MFLLKAFIKTKILHAVEFPTINDALKYASLLEKNKGVIINWLTVFNNAFRIFGKKED